MRLERTFSDGSTIIEIYDTTNAYLGSHMEFMWGYSFIQNGEHYDKHVSRANHEVVERIASGESKIIDIEYDNEAYILIEYWFRFK